MSATGVFTRNKRVQFVKGQITSGTPDAGFVACGDGTRFALEATLDQIAEIFYRVKDAWFVGGHVLATSTYASDSSSYSFLITASTTAPAHRSSNFELSLSYLIRGYTTDTTDGDPLISAHNLPYLGAEYITGYAPAYLGGGPYYARDIGDNERGMWLVGEDTTPIYPLWNGTDYQVTNAFTWSGLTYEDQTGTDFFTSLMDDLTVSGEPLVYKATSSGVSFSGKVAVVKATESDGFYAPTNRFFIEMVFFAASSDIGYANINTYKEPTPGTSGGGVYVQICDYVMQLAPLTVGGSPVELRCPLYGQTDAVDSDVTNAYSAYSDFIHKAKSWWPYAKSGGPVWDSATGIAL